MRHTDAESGMKALVEASPDTAMQIIAKRQPFLAKRIQDEPDPEKAKQLMLQAEDMWDALMEMLEETSGKDAKKVKKLMMLYDRKRWKRRRRNFIFTLTIVLFVPIAGMYWLFTGLFDLFPYEDPDEQTVVVKGWELKGLLRGTHGRVYFVLIDAAKEADRMVYDAAIKKFCSSALACFIWFWSDETKMFVPSGSQDIWDMTDAQLSASTAVYQFIPHSNFKKWRWNCKVVNDPNNCWRP